MIRLTCGGTTVPSAREAQRLVLPSACLIAILMACGKTGQYDGVGKTQTGLYPANQGGKYGYIDDAGRFVIKPQFEDAWPFLDSLAVARTGGKYGYVNSKGRFVIKPRFDDASFFASALAAVRIGDKWGYIDKTGDFVIKPHFDAVSNFCEGLAFVGVGNRWGSVDTTGQLAIEPQFEDASQFSDGLAGVMVDRRWGYIDKTGNFVIEPQFDAASPFYKGVAEVRTGDRHRYIDRIGRYVTSPPVGDTAYRLLAIRGADGWGYIDVTGKVCWENPTSNGTSGRNILHNDTLRCFGLQLPSGWIPKEGTSDETVLKLTFGEDTGKSVFIVTAVELSGSSKTRLDTTSVRALVENPPADPLSAFRKGQTVVTVESIHLGGLPGVFAETRLSYVSLAGRELPVKKLDWYFLHRGYLLIFGAELAYNEHHRQDIVRAMKTLDFYDLPKPISLKEPPPDEADIPVVPYWKVEVKPKPINIPVPTYPEIARTAGIEGQAVVEALVDVDGSVADARILTPSGSASLDQSAVDAAMRSKFSPAKQRDKAVRVWISIPFRFTLE